MGTTTPFSLNELQLVAFEESSAYYLKLQVGTGENSQDNILLSGKTVKIILTKVETDSYEMEYDEVYEPTEYSAYSKYFFSDLDDSFSILLPELSAEIINGKANLIIGTADERLGKAVKGSTQFLMEKLAGIDEQPFLVLKTSDENSGSLEFWYSSE